MDPKTIAFIQDLSAVLKKHKAGLFYTTSDDGIHVVIGDSYATTANIGWPTNGESLEIDAILSVANNPVTHGGAQPRSCV